MAGSIFIPLVSVFNNKGISEAKSGLASISGVVKNLKTTALAAAGSMAAIGAVSFVKDAVNSARDLQSSYVGLNGLFGDLGPMMTQYTKDAQAIGLSQLEASRSVTFLGSALSATGMPIGDVADKTKNLIGIASDLAATFGLPLQEALTGIGATFRGEYDPIERFGVAIKQAQVNALLATRGQKGLTGQMLAGAQAQARYDLLLQATSKTQGNYAKQQDSLYVKQQNMAAAFENMKASLGASLLEPLSALMGALMPIIDLIGKVLTPIFTLLGQVITMLSPVIPPLTEAFMSIVSAVTPINEVLIKLIKPLLIPFISAFKLLSAIITPFIPLIELVANVLGAVLTPAFTVIGRAIDFVLQGLKYLFAALGNLPFIGDAFKNANAALEDFTKGLDDSTNSILGVTTTHNAMTDQLSKKLPAPDISGTTTALDKIVKKSKVAADKINQLLSDALNVQKGLLNSASLSNLFTETSDTVINSIVLVDGKFKSVTRTVTGSAKDLGTSFKDILKGMRTFRKQINKLADLGLDPELRNQIVSAGPETGSAIAAAILSSGQEGVDALNNTYKDIKKVSGDIGATVGTAMQNSGADIGNGLIDGIKSTADRLNEVAESLGEEYAASFDKGANKNKTDKTDKTDKTNKTDKTKKTNNSVLPKGYSTDTVFIGSLPAYGPFTNTAGVFGQDRSKNKLVMGRDLKNPFSGLKNPFAGKGVGTYQDFKDWATTNAANEKLFTTNVNKATEYNIQISVAPGANTASINNALVAAIQEYERKKGKIN
jgi:hypothetical protein